MKHTLILLDRAIAECEANIEKFQNYRTSDKLLKHYWEMKFEYSMAKAMILNELTLKEEIA